MGTKFSLFGYYTLNYANSDASGAGSFPSTGNDISLDYGRAPFDIRHRVFFGGTMGLPYNFRLSPFLIASSGIPFNITTGKDLNGDSIFNDRPAFATSQSNPQNVIINKYGSFNLVPQAGETIVPIDSLTSAGRFSLNLRLSKTFGFGKKAEAANAGAGGPGAGGTFGRGPGGPGDRGPRGGGRGMDGGGANNNRYNLTFSVNARNVFNNVNLTEEDFGQGYRSAASGAEVRNCAGRHARHSRQAETAAEAQETIARSRSRLNLIRDCATTPCCKFLMQLLPSQKRRQGSRTSRIFRPDRA